MTLEEAIEALRAIPALVEAVEKLTVEVRSLKEQNKPLPEAHDDLPQLPPGCISLRDAQRRRFITVRQAAYLLQMSEKSVRRAIDRGLLRTSKGLRVIRIPSEEIENYTRYTV